ncbi:MAG TPA: helix-turn-helix domain-containing GNAT family N-acetyltransferase [Candidatus Dormibacteraeota bacterium]
MDQAMVSQVRRFNRIVTQRVGALDDRFVGRERPLGEARLLWELGDGARDVRSLRTQLGLDSGYMSRMLHSLEAAGMITLSPGAADHRLRTARLTAAGQAERAVLDRRSDDLATALLEPLSAEQRSRLVASMAEVERLMTAGLVVMAPIDPADPRAQHCLRAYNDELNTRFDTGWDPARSIPATVDVLRPPAGLFVLATLHEHPVACGALKFHPGAPAELKRMWVSSSVRGLGIGRRLLQEMESRAVAGGADAVRLETNGTLIEAISLYRSSGYVEVPAFNDEPYAHHWFEKRLR